LYTTISKNSLYSLEVRVTDGKGNNAVDLDVQYSIIKTLTNDVVSSGSMQHVGSGVYKVDISLSEVGQYRVLYNLTDYYTNSIETIIVLEDTVENQVKKVQEQIEQLYQILSSTVPIIISPPATTPEPAVYSSVLNKNNPEFESLYERMLAQGWILVRTAGPVYYFEKK